MSSGLKKIVKYFDVHTVRLDNYQRFFSPTDAQLDSLKNNLKFAFNPYPANVENRVSSK